MKYYIKKYSNGCIADIISFQKEGYSEIEYNYALPQFILNGYYKFIDGEFVVDETAREEFKANANTLDSNVISELQNKNEELSNKVIDLQAENEGLTNRVSTLQEVNATQENMISDLQIGNAELFTTMDNILTDIIPSLI